MPCKNAGFGGPWNIDLPVATAVILYPLFRIINHCWHNPYEPLVTIFISMKHVLNQLHWGPMTHEPSWWSRSYRAPANHNGCGSVVCQWLIVGTTRKIAGRVVIGLFPMINHWQPQQRNGYDQPLFVCQWLIIALPEAVVSWFHHGDLLRLGYIGRVVIGSLSLIPGLARRWGTAERLQLLGQRKPHGRDQPGGVRGGHGQIEWVKIHVFN